MASITPWEDRCPSPTLAGALFAKSPSPRSPRQSGDMIDAAGLERLLLRQRICNMFRRYLPAKMHRLPEALERCRGREENLLTSLVAKMGPEPHFTPQQLRLAEIVLERVMRDEGEELPNMPADDLCQTSPAGRSPRKESFASAVAQTSALHAMKARLLEQYLSRRGALINEEGHEREVLARAMASEGRGKMIFHLRQLQTVALQRREQERREAEAEWLARRQQQLQQQKLERLAADELQKFLVVAGEVQNEERTARRVQFQAFLDAASVILREDKHRERLRRKRDAEVDQAHRAAELQARAEAVKERIEARRRRMLEELEKADLTRKESNARMDQYVQKVRRKYKLIEEERQAEAARIQEEITRRRSMGRGFIGFGTRGSSMLGTTLSETLGTSSSHQLDIHEEEEEEEQNEETGWDVSSELPPIRNAPRVAELLPALEST